MGQPSVMVNPRGIGIRGDKLYVVSNLTHIVYTFSLDGERLDESFGEMGSMDNQFILPNGLFIDDNGRIYITDTANLRVAVWQ